MSKSYQGQWEVHGSIIRQRGTRFQVETHCHGQRKRHTCKTREEAEAYAKALKAQIAAEGAAALSIHGKQRVDALELLKAFPTRETQADAIAAACMLASRGEGCDLSKRLTTPLAEAVRFWLVHHPASGAMPTLDEALAAYLKSKGHRRATTLTELRQRLTRLVKDFPGLSVAEVTTDTLDGWLTRTLPDAENRRRYLNVFRTFFGYVCTRHGMEVNPAQGVIIEGIGADEREVEAYTVEETRRIMLAAGASPLASKLVPVLAIGFFAGLRPAEVQGLDWSDVSLAARRVRVSPETAKKRRSRYVDISENLAEWLAPYAQESGPVAPPFMTFRRQRARIMEQANCRLIKDGFRHSFGTYHLAAFEDANKTAAAMGHRGNTDLVYLHYRRLVTREEGQAYWTIRPPKLIEAHADEVAPDVSGPSAR
jgi:integrase